MQPTLNPEPDSNDYVLIKHISDVSEVEENVGSIVFAEWNDRRLIKRLQLVTETREGSNLKCWIDSDAGQGQRKYYDSHLFGYIDCSAVKGKVVGIVFPPSRIATDLKE